LPIEIPDSIDITPVDREPFVAIFPEGHPVASKEGIRLRDLRVEKPVTYERVCAPGHHDLVMGILSRAGVIPEVTQTASEMATIVSLVELGNGCCSGTNVSHKTSDRSCSDLPHPRQNSDLRDRYDHS